jgi:hypothetical protein
MGGLGLLILAVLPKMDNLIIVITMTDSNMVAVIPVWSQI